MNIGSNGRRAIITVIAGVFSIAAMCVTADVEREVSHSPSSASISQTTSGGADQAASSAMVHCLSGPRHGCTPMVGDIGGDENRGSGDSSASQQSSDASQQSAGAPAGQQDGNSKWVVEAFSRGPVHFATWEE